MRNLELLSPSLLAKDPEKVREVELLQRALWREIGWHYLVDLVWVLQIIGTLGLPSGAKILDAGAGRGLLQYLLAARGYEVTSVDYYPFNPPVLARLAFPHHQERTQKQVQEDAYQDHVVSEQETRLRVERFLRRIRKVPFHPFLLLHLYLRRIGMGNNPVGMINWTKSDIRDMHGIPDRSIDVVVSISAIEHLPRESLKTAIRELERVLKGSGSMIITTSAAESQDWFHVPSRGWCFSPSTLIELFNLPRSMVYSEGEYRDVLELYKHSRVLERKLASAYFTSGNNGMPWGVWDPEYIPVGIVKVVG